MLAAQSSRKGFTLIELMISISVVAIIATVGMVAYSSTQRTARDAKRKGDVEDIKNALYLVRTGSGGWCKGYGCPWSSTADHATWGMEGTATNSMKAAL